MRFRHQRKITTEQNPVRIVADAAIATRRIRNGRLVPLLILDTTDRPDLEEFIRVHQYFPPGDVELSWGIMNNSRDSVVLYMSFKKPAVMDVIVEFDIVKQGILVNQMLAVSALCLQAGHEGDRFSKNPNASKVIVEIPNTGYQEIWNKQWHKRVVREMQHNGLGRQQAKRAATLFIDELRDLGGVRVGKP